MLGEITPSQTTGSSVEFECIDIGNLSSATKNDIVVGSGGEPHVTLYNPSLTKLWDFNTSTSNTINDVSIGNVNLSSDYDEVAIATNDDNKIYLLNSSGQELWNYDIGSPVNAVSIGNLTSDPGEEIVIGGNDNKITALNVSGQLKWNYDIDETVYSLDIGELNTTYSGNEIVVGAGSSVYIISSSGNPIRNITISNTVRAVKIGDITADTGNEIAIGTSNGTVFVFTQLGSFKWNYYIGDTIYSISIGDSTSDTGNEIAIGSGDDKIYQLDSNGNFIWSYTTGHDVKGVVIGDVSTDTLNETLGVSRDKSIYILNFNYYPTNTSIDIGNDGDYDWSSSSEKLRNFDYVENSSIGQSIQNYLDSCGTQICNVPFVFHSDAAGNLNVSYINITYNYNASEAINSENSVSAWSRLNNTFVNTSIGNEVVNISYPQNSANNITINYVKVNAAASSSCDFWGTSYSIITESGLKVCNISSNSYQIPSVGNLPITHRLWDDTMSTSIPAYLNTTGGQVNSTGFWIKNMTIYTANDAEILYNVTANITIDENYVTSDERIFVDWDQNGVYHDITPDSGTSDCDTDDPTYTVKLVGSDNFFVCKEDTNGNGVYDFFNWKQPHTSSRNYRLEGSSNYPLELTNAQINSSSSIWNSAFNFSVDVGDYEGNNATISLWLYFDRNSSWSKIETKNLSTNGTTWFTKASDKTWTGNNRYMFEYRDYNESTGAVLHLWQNSSYYDFTVTKHSIEVLYLKGDNSNVNRTGTNTTELIVRINDTSNASYVEDNVNCSFWITTDGSIFTLVNQTSTNSTGHCSLTFNPDSSFSAGDQVWISGVDNDVFYDSTNSSSYNLTIHVPININFHSSTVGKNGTRGGLLDLVAGIYDENNNLVPNTQSQYTCTWYINNSQVYQGPVNNTGYCSYNWWPTCSNITGLYPVNVTLSGSPYSYYHVQNNQNSTNIRLKDTLNITVIYPIAGTIFHEQETVQLNSTISDGCGIPENSYTVSWYLEKASSCPSSNPVTTGDNDSYSLEATCDPREQLIITNATGDYYNSNKDNVTIFIYGWSEVSFENPSSGNITNRTAGEVTYTDLVCKVTDNVSTAGVQGYTIQFWDGTESIGTNTTNSTGHAVYNWNISSNVTVAEGNHTLKCNISEDSSLYYNVSVNESESWMIIREVDYNLPFFTGTYATSTSPYNNVTIEANVTDWFGVDKVWTVVIYPNSTNYTYYLSNTSTNTLTGTWRTTLNNVSNLGSYDYTIYANDTSDQINSTSGWFDIYTRLFFIGNATNNDNNNITLDFTFYRPGTNKTMDIPNTYVSGGSYNISVFNTNVDMKLKVIDHELYFRNVDINSSVRTLFDENATNITDPINIDNVSVSEILLQSTTKNKMTALAIDNNLEFDNLTITLNFTENLNAYSDLSKPALRIYQCSNWELDNRTGCSGSWNMLTTTLNSSSNTISADLTSLSCFVVAEYCPSCAGGNEGNGDTGTTGGGGGGSSSATCGNGICEATENIENCPEDCGKAKKPPFNVKTNLTDVEIEAGKLEIYDLWINNTHDGNINVSIHFGGSTSHFLSVDENFIELNFTEEKDIPIYASIPTSTEPAVYTGEILISGEGYTQRLPVTITVPIVGSMYLDIDVKTLTSRVNPNGTAIFRVQVHNIGYRKSFNISINHTAKRLDSNEIIFRDHEVKEIETSLLLMKNIHIPKNATVGEYSYEVEVKFDGEQISSADTFIVTQSFFTTKRIRIIILITLLVVSVPTVYYSRKFYKKWKASKVRYIFPVDPKSLPKGEIWLGQVAETDQKATFEMKELKTHVLTAGATGSGKTVSSMIMIEELLEKKIPVVVFDPTAQWTGFVRPCKDQDLLRFYNKFGMNLRDVKPYKGMIYEVKDPKVKIDFKKYMKPGEITIFTLNKLKPGEYDEAVKSIVETIFEQGWEESTDLQLVIVLDEVHRLLEKYGGKGGYVALEKACREFRKWGIGLIMVSQVLSDFKEAIKGNVLTEVQLHTKSLGDLERIERKFGEDYAKRVTKLEVGIGMMQNPKYNKGKPYFVAFRPPYHSPHKIPDKDLELYKKYENLIKGIEEKIESLKKSEKDVFGLNVELNLAKDKLKKGRFRMAKIYIDSLTKSLSKGKE
ncbi:MAG: DUF853 family protein [Candidatus Aenigmarchaeota archaeon]|nr:DUF853 family protein [Candidatus Aenigmarchaeota archaeon]